LKVPYGKILAFSRLKKFGKNYFWNVGMENENILQDLIPHFDRYCLYVFPL